MWTFRGVVPLFTHRRTEVFIYDTEVDRGTRAPSGVVYRARNDDTAFSTQYDRTQSSSASHARSGDGVEVLIMATESEVLESHDLDPMDESRNVQLDDDKLENGSKGELIKLAGQLRDRRNELNQMASDRASTRDDSTRRHARRSTKHRNTASSGTSSTSRSRSTRRAATSSTPRPTNCSTRSRR